MSQIFPKGYNPQFKFFTEIAEILEAVSLG
jgi:hypothetical protein